MASLSDDISHFAVPAISRATPWSTDVLMIGTPRVILVIEPKLRAFMTGNTWSWYMPRYASVSFNIFFVNAVSADFGYEILIFFRLNSFTTGIKTSFSSEPIFPPSPAWGFRPSNVILGLLILS